MISGILPQAFLVQLWFRFKFNTHNGRGQMKMVELTHILFNYILLAEPLSDKLVQWVIISHKHSKYTWNQQTWSLLYWSVRNNNSICIGSGYALYCLFILKQVVQVVEKPLIPITVPSHTPKNSITASMQILVKIALCPSFHLFIT